MARLALSRTRLGRAGGGVAAISTGVVAGQAVTLLATPLLARLYSPAAYGAFASLMAAVAVAATAGSLRLESAIPIATPAESRQMIRAGALSSLLAGMICAALVLALGHPAISSSPWLGLALVIYIVWVSAMYSVLTAYSLRTHQYGAVARRNLLQALGTAGGQLLLARWLLSAMGLTAGLALGRTLGVASLVRESDLMVRRDASSEATMPQTLKRYWRFPLVFMPSALLNVLGTQLPILLVVRAYGAESAGNLAQAIAFGGIPAALLGAAVSSVMLAELATRVRAGESDQRARYLRVSGALLPLGACWFFVLVIAGRPLLPIVLGPEWSDSGQYLAALAVGASLGLVASPVSVVFVLYERALVNVMLDVLRILLVTGLGVAAWTRGFGPVGAVFLMSIGMGAVYVALWLLGLRTVSPSRGVAAGRSGKETRS